MRIFTDLLLLAYYAAFVLVESAARLLRRCRVLRTVRLRPEPYSPGLSIIIPERDNLRVLEPCLRTLSRALEHAGEPAEIIVVASGVYRGEHSRLANLYGARLIYSEQPLDYARAISAGVAAANYDWVYLLNNDMVLHRHALAEVMRRRGPRVFAVASQIFFKNRAARREETGWGAMDASSGVVELFDAAVPRGCGVRGALYAGGGASLFRKSLLQRVLDASHPYAPFYWEDVEWGALAWRMGFETLFCPASKVWHTHRATVCRYFTAEEVRRIFRRNGSRFQLRNLSEPRWNAALFLKLRHADWRTLAELLSPRDVLRTLGARWRAQSLPYGPEGLPCCGSRYYIKPFSELARPAAVLVSPYAIFPPAHGGAVRMKHMLRALARRFDVIVISDEAERYGAGAEKYFGHLAAIHLVSGRRDTGRQHRVTRIRSHSRPLLREQIDRAIDVYDPAVVLVEYMELGGLVRGGKRGLPWILTLHDVLLDGTRRADRRELALMRQFDAVATCSAEDAAVVPLSNVTVVPNGAECRRFPYAPSRSRHAMLFAGPFRYAPNLAGIRAFLDQVYPVLKRHVPDAELWILGGHGAGGHAGEAPFRQPGVRIFDYTEHPEMFLRECALAINPVRDIRGSCIKVMEAIAAGRCCVSTRDGARGLLDEPPRSLVVVPDVRDFLEPLRRLLCDEDTRVALERPQQTVIEQLDWQAAGASLLSLLAVLTETAPETETRTHAHSH